MSDDQFTPAGHGPAEQPVGLQEYLRVVRRRKWIVIAAVVLVPLAAIGYSLQQTPVYESSAKVLLSQQNLANALTGVVDPNASVDNATLVETQTDVARVPEIAENAVSRAELSDVSSEDFLDSSSVTSGTDSEILTFTYEDDDPELARMAATAYAEEYVDYRREVDTASLAQARDEVTARIDELSADGEQDTPLYASLVKREQQLQALEALQTANARVIQTADEGEQTAPRTTLNAVLGLLVGLVVGLGLAFLREALDTRMRSAEQISRGLQLPLLARIPPPAKKLRDESLVTMAEPRGAATEAFRMLRTSLQFATLDRDIRSIMITSALPQEGKSTTVANLAVTCARAGQHVILLDLDLRRPRVERFFDLEGRPGVTQVVLKKIGVDDALVPVPLLPAQPSLEGGATGSEPNGGSGRLEILPSGQTPPDPGEFVASNALAQLLAGLRERADLVLIDSPPVLQIGDALTISANVDALVMAARMQMLRRGVVAEAHRIIASAPTHKLGFVLVGAKAQAGYGSGYGYGDSYLAHYAPEEMEPRRPRRRRRSEVSS